MEASVVRRTNLHSYVRATENVKDAVKVPSPLCSKKMKVDKALVVKKHQSRFSRRTETVPRASRSPQVEISVKPKRKRKSESPCSSNVGKTTEATKNKQMCRREKSKSKVKAPKTNPHATAENKSTEMSKSTTNRDGRKRKLSFPEGQSQSAPFVHTKVKMTKR